MSDLKFEVIPINSNLCIILGFSNKNLVYNIVKVKLKYHYANNYLHTYTIKHIN